MGSIMASRSAVDGVIRETGPAFDDRKSASYVGSVSNVQTT